MITPNAKRAECFAKIAADKAELRLVKYATREKAYTLKAWESIPEHLLRPAVR
jgi:hypothetical protein